MSNTSSYTVQGMTCNSCATKVTNAVNHVVGVTDTDVDLTTGTLTVAGPDVSDAAVRDAITGAGYRVS
ncbi:heavy-metal-associated domain-containing protein [Knoellia sp. CPCC 206453]|uniref:heavy-metal-associated domain-containing protein n=1 Tax=Knoellia pratensis TaxID=3404796 RepID=UPI00361FDE2E